MSKIKNGKTEEGKTKWFYFRKPKLKGRSKIRHAMYIAKMISTVKSAHKRISAKKEKGTLVTKTIQYGDKR